MKASLVIGKVSQEDLSTNYTCKLDSDNQPSISVTIFLTQKGAPGLLTIDNILDSFFFLHLLFWLQKKQGVEIWSFFFFVHSLLFLLESDCVCRQHCCCNDCDHCCVFKVSKRDQAFPKRHPQLLWHLFRWESFALRLEVWLCGVKGQHDREMQIYNPFLLNPVLNRIYVYVWKWMLFLCT